MIKLLLLCLAGLPLLAQPASKPGGKVRTYYVAADEVDWNYVPSGHDHMTGKPFDARGNIWVERTKNRIGATFRKALYREYTDGTYSRLKPREGHWAHLGTLGPIFHAEVGDTLRIHFKNNATKPYSMHPHGVFYKKDSEGALYADGTSGADKKDDAVPPGGTYTYVWEAVERAGPGPGDGSSVVWLYHSHVNEPKDVNAGLIGAMVVTARGQAKPDGSPRDIDRELFTLFMVYDENQSWYLDHNIATYTLDPKSVEKGEFLPVDIEGNSSLFVGGGFATVNHKYSINGYLFGNMPTMKMGVGERVRWYLLSIGDGFNFHSPHWHGNVTLSDNKRIDVITLLPAQMVVADMVPDNPGSWMFHCHISDHLEAGMHAHYEVLPK